MGEWTQTIATIASILGVCIALLAYLARQFNRIGDHLVQLDGRLQNVQRQQARMLGFLEGRGVMGKASADVEGA